MLLLIDNYDSFTYNLRDYLRQLGADCLVTRNDEMEINDIEALQPERIIISPGPKKPRDAGIVMEVIQRFHQHIPILGICLGHQGIGEFFGGEVARAGKPMHGKTSIIRHNGDEIFNEIPENFKVMRYHSLVVRLLQNQGLQIIAASDDNEIMALKHVKYPVYGVQFHPESILTEFGLKLLGNWLELTTSSVIRKT